VKSTKEGIQGVLEKKPLLRKPLNAGIDKINAEVDDFVQYIDDIQAKLIDASGDGDGTVNEGDYLDGDITHKPRGKKNKDVTTKLMVLGVDRGYGSSGTTYEGEGPYGPEIAKRVEQLKEKLSSIYQETVSNPDVKKEGKLKDEEVKQKIEGFINSIPLAIESLEEITKKAKAGTVTGADDQFTAWSKYKFKQMPLAACLPALTKLQTDARNTQATAVNKLAELVGGREIKLNKFFPVINAKKGYVIKGEKFEADISLGAYSSDIPPENIKLTVDGARKSVGKDGVAKYSVTTNSTGKKTIKLTATVTNPLTGEVSTSAQDFEYEVGVRSANVSADKMNVMYIGVPNPISVTAAGISSNELKVNCSGCDLKKSAQGKYVATVNKPGEIER